MESSKSRVASKAYHTVTRWRYACGKVGDLHRICPPHSAQRRVWHAGGSVVVVASRTNRASFVSVMSQRPAAIEGGGVGLQNT